ncbi:hypothetical protein BaRGS_00014091, partial [Batillaria attramentaria]
VCPGELTGVHPKHTARVTGDNAKGSKADSAHVSGQALGDGSGVLDDGTDNICTACNGKAGPSVCDKRIRKMSKRPTESGWGSDEDDLLTVNDGGISAFRMQDEDEIDEAALLGLDDDTNFNHSQQHEHGDDHADYEQEQQDLLEIQVDPEEEEVLDYEDEIDYSQDTEAGGLQESAEFDTGDRGDDVLQAESHDLSQSESHDHYEEQQENVDYSQEHQDTTYAGEGGEEERGESESDSNSDGEDRGRLRFKSERANIVSLSKAKSRSDIPDTLEVSAEQQAQLNKYTEPRQRDRGYSGQRSGPYGARDRSVRGYRDNRRGQPMRGGPWGVPRQPAPPPFHRDLMRPPPMFQPPMMRNSHPQPLMGHPCNRSPERPFGNRMPGGPMPLMAAIIPVPSGPAASVPASWSGAPQPVRREQPQLLVAQSPVSVGLVQHHPGAGPQPLISEGNQPFMYRDDPRNSGVGQPRPRQPFEQSQGPQFQSQGPRMGSPTLLQPGAPRRAPQQGLPIQRTPPGQQPQAGFGASQQQQGLRHHMSAGQEMMGGQPNSQAGLLGPPPDTVLSSPPRFPGQRLDQHQAPFSPPFDNNQSQYVMQQQQQLSPGVGSPQRMFRGGAPRQQLRQPQSPRIFAQRRPPQKQQAVVMARKLTQQAKFTQQAKAAVSQNKNITVVPIVPLKRRSTDTSSAVSPAKAAKPSEPLTTEEEPMDEDLKQALEKQKQLREMIKKRKEANRRKQAAVRRQELEKKLAEQGLTIEDVEGETGGDTGEATPVTAPLPETGTVQAGDQPQAIKRLQPIQTRISMVQPSQGGNARTVLASRGRGRGSPVGVGPGAARVVMPQGQRQVMRGGMAKTQSVIMIPSQKKAIITFLSKVHAMAFTKHWN